MATHNMFSDEVVKMRHAIRAYGSYKKYLNAPHHNAYTYKLQALQELAARLELESKIDALRSLVMAVDDVLDCEYQGADEWATEKMKRLVQVRLSVQDA